MTQLELDSIRQRLGTNVDLTSAVNELSSVLDRKKLLMETLNNNTINLLKAERDEWKQKSDKFENEKSTIENELQAKVLKFQNECIRLEVEWESARKLVEPLESENNELRSQCRELTDDLVASQKLLAEGQISRLKETMASNEANLLRKQLTEALETAECKFQ